MEWQRSLEKQSDDWLQPVINEVLSHPENEHQWSDKVYWCWILGNRSVTM